MIEYASAELYLNTLDPRTDQHIFFTCPDQKETKNSEITGHLIGSFQQHFGELSRRSMLGAAVYVTVNATDLKGRKKSNMSRPRAIWQEADEPGVPIPSLPPNMVVGTSPGKFHRYWLLDPKEPSPSWEEWDAVMARMVMDFGSDKNAKDRCRVLRLPGFPHQKDPARPFIVDLIRVTK